MEDKLRDLKKCMNQTVFKKVDFDREYSLHVVKQAERKTTKRGPVLKQRLLSGFSVVVCIGFILIALLSVTGLNQSPHPQAQLTALKSPTVSGILNRASKAEDHLSSFHEAFNFTISAQDGKDKFNVASDGTLDVGGQLPVGHLILHSHEAGKPTTTEAYVTNSTTYSRISGDPKWTKKATQGTIQTGDTKSYDPYNDLPLLKKHLDLVQLTKKDNSYVLDANIEKGNFSQIIKDYFAANLTQNMIQTFDQLNLDHLHCTYVFDKNTYLPESTKLVAKGSMDTQTGGTIQVTISFIINFSKINQFQNITIPENVLSETK